MFHSPLTGLPVRKRKRRGATALEYVFAITLIFVVCIAVIQHLGSITKNSFSNSQQKIEKKDGK
jgi:Flp pilus assembly pilin Flp